jgi:glyoxylase-like metal-dependent hydrolase (beta-lactamase superfamily II)
MEIFRLTFNPIEVNTYILADKSGDCAIIDCGCYDDQEFSELTDFLESHNLKPVLLLNTHCHLDHIFGNKFMLKRYGLRPHSPESDEYNRLNATKHALMFGLSMDLPPEPDAFVSHLQELEFGTVKLLALHVPGHSSGSISYYCKEAGAVFTGDALFAGSIGRTDLPGGNYDTLLTSIKTNLLTLPPDTIVYPGHGPDTTVEKEMKTNPYLT